MQLCLCIRHCRSQAVASNQLCALLHAALPLHASGDEGSGAPAPDTFYTAGLSGALLQHVVAGPGCCCRCSFPAGAGTAAPAAAAGSVLSCPLLDCHCPCHCPCHRSPTPLVLPPPPPPRCAAPNIAGSEVQMSSLAGKVTLVVNVASYCGYTGGWVGGACRGGTTRGRAVAQLVHDSADRGQPVAPDGACRGVAAHGQQTNSAELGSTGSRASLPTQTGASPPPRFILLHPPPSQGC